MLSRRQLRIKALQALYAFMQSVNDQLEQGEKEMLKSLDKLYELYIYQLSLLIELVDFSKKRMEDNKQKFFPTEDDLKPNTRFVENQFYNQLVQNQDLHKYINQYKINWVDEEEMIRKLMVQIRDSKDYIDYLAKPLNTYKDDKEIFIRIIKKHLSRSELLQFYYEEKSIYWSDDFHTANLLAIKTIKAYEPSWHENHKMPLMFGKEIDNSKNEDKEFIVNLFRKTIIHSEEYEKLIDEKVKNWEMDRIAIMDILIIKMALVELLEFPSVPIKVTLNEYIELAKLYSTPKSKVFVNGILDKLIGDLIGQKKIKKTGRGLLES
jgi:N utilization substance protein B